MTGGKIFSFKDLRAKHFSDNLFERWRIFKDSLSEKYGRKKPKYKILSKRDIIKELIYFLVTTTDTYNSKQKRLKRGEAFKIPKGEVACFKEDTIIDINDTVKDSEPNVRLAYSSGQLLDQREILPQKYQEIAIKICKIINPPSLERIKEFRVIAGESVSDSTDTLHSSFI